MTSTPPVDPCAKSPGQRLRQALAELAQQQTSSGESRAPTATALCELAGVSRNALYRYHADVLQDLHKLQQQRHRDPDPAKQKLQRLRDENADLRHQAGMLAALVDHYFAAWQETGAKLARRERELADLRRDIKPNLVSSRN